jgi:hypothetical protein
MSNESEKIVRSHFNSAELSKFDSSQTPEIQKIGKRILELEKELDACYEKWERETRYCIFNEHVVPLDFQVKHHLHGCPCLRKDNGWPGLYGNCGTEYCPLVNRERL